MAKFYHKEKVIGSGTFGNVWLVKSKVNSGYFVLKEINLSSMNATETQQSLTEVTVLSRCRHRNIIKYKDAVIDHKKRMLSIVMEYADGGDLYTAIMMQRGVPFKEKTVITWFTQICLALQYIHHLSILHRDLKTRNIFLTRDGQIKLGDFGIARCLMETNDLATTAIGTPYYLSPEICHQKPYNHKSDMWAAGCILFEMAALFHPFQACNFPHLLSLIISGNRQELPRHCGSLIKDLVQKLLNENPELRPSADDILDLPSLQPYLSDVWRVQNSSNSAPMSKMINEQMNSRRHTLGGIIKDSSLSPMQRRASISSVESRGVKTRFGFIGKKNIPSSKLATTVSRPHSVKICKKSPKMCAIKKEQYLTYKVLNPVTFREKLSNMICSGLRMSQTESKVKRALNSKKRCDETDGGYQSEGYMKCAPQKAEDFNDAILGAKPKTSTQKNIEIPAFKLEESSLDDVFVDNANEMMNHNVLPDGNKDTHTECPHSQCQQCMLDILWKNRIRGTIGPMVKTDGRSELIKKLQVVFGEKNFDIVYQALVNNWENKENTDTPKSLIDMTNSLNYSQLQHIPLMMQLIQLDLVPK